MTVETQLPTLKGLVPDEYLQDPDTDFDAELKSVAAAGTLAPIVRNVGKSSPPAQSSPNARARAEDQFRRGRNPYSAKNQPRDYRGQFREVLARLKVTLGESNLNDEVQKVKEAEQAELNGDYAKSADAATDVIQMVDGIKEGSINSTQLDNIKNVTRELGKVIAYLPLPQGDQNAKLRFSDLPPATQQLLDNMKQRIIKKLAPDKAAKLLDALNAFTSGQVQMSSDELQSELSTLLRYLID